ncbi:hypothetical protein [Nocardia terrae]|uniref:hypothetical protein n=1 Tax=Nocardia terrae TaxID=2675851 RepID=UPI001F4570D9|nr:hypothetical protein [Nocardia terrae]
MSEQATGEVRSVETFRRPAGFTRERLDWVPWVEPIELADADESQRPLLEGTAASGPISGYWHATPRSSRIAAPMTKRSSTAGRG